MKVIFSPIMNYNHKNITRLQGRSIKTFIHASETELNLERKTSDICQQN